MLNSKYFKLLNLGVIGVFWGEMLVSDLIFIGPFYDKNRGLGANLGQILASEY